MKKHKIGLITSQFPPYIADATGAYSYKLIKNLNEFDFDVYLVTNKNPQIKNDDKYFKENINLIPIINIENTDNQIKNLYKYFKFGFKTYSKIKKEKYTTIISTQAEVFAHIPMLLMRKQKPKWVVIIGDAKKDNPYYNDKSGIAIKLQYKLFTMLERKAMKKANKIIFVSRPIANKFTEIDANKKIAIYPGSMIDYRKNIQEENAKKTIFYGGSLTKNKNIAPLCKTIINANLNEKVKIIIAGQIDDVVEQEINEYSKQIEIIYLGFINQNEIEKLCYTADMFYLIDDSIKSEAKTDLFASKLGDYFLTHKNVLAFTRTNSLHNDYLNEYNNPPFSYDKKDEWVELFRKYYNGEIKSNYAMDELFSQENNDLKMQSILKG